MGNPYVEQLAGIISEQLMLPGQTTEQVLAELETINKGDGFTLDIQHGHEGHRSWTRHEGVRLPAALWNDAVALGMQWAGITPAREEKTEVIRLRVTASEKDAIASAAQEEGKTVSEYVRGMVFTKIARVPVYERLTPADVAAMAARKDGAE